MRIYIVLMSLLLVVMQGCAPTTYLKKVPNDFFRYQPNQPIHISAHRGGGDYSGYPENCIASFGWLAKQMPVIIECDINLSKDSVLLMMHDDQLDRTSTGKGVISATDWQQMKNLQLKDNKGKITQFGIPTLGEVLAWGKGKVAFTLDVKKSVPYEMVVAAVQKAKAQRYAAVITYNERDAAKVYALDKSIMISVTIRNKEEYNRHAALGIPDGNMIAFVGTRMPDSSLCSFLHNKGIRCILGTLGNLDKMAEAKGDSLYSQFVRLGADILSSDRPLEAWQQVK